LLKRRWSEVFCRRRPVAFLGLAPLIAMYSLQALAAEQQGLAPLPHLLTPRLLLLNRQAAVHLEVP
jgi:hypothetical protein